MPMKVLRKIAYRDVSVCVCACACVCVHTWWDGSIWLWMADALMKCQWCITSLDFLDTQGWGVECCSLLLLQKWLQRGLEAISLWHCWGVTKAQVVPRGAYRSSTFLGMLFRILCVCLAIQTDLKPDIDLLGTMLRWPMPPKPNTFIFTIIYAAVTMIEIETL